MTHAEIMTLLQSFECARETLDVSLETIEFHDDEPVLIVCDAQAYEADQQVTPVAMFGVRSRMRRIASRLVGR